MDMEEMQYKLCIFCQYGKLKFPKINNTYLRRIFVFWMRFLIAIYFCNTQSGHVYDILYLGFSPKSMEFAVPSMRYLKPHIWNIRQSRHWWNPCKACFCQYGRKLKFSNFGFGVSRAQQYSFIADILYSSYHILRE